MSGLKYWLWLTSRKGMDPVSALTVLDHFITPERAYYVDREDYEAVPLKPQVRQGLMEKELDCTVRFDVAEVYSDGMHSPESIRIEYLENAF